MRFLIPLNAAALLASTVLASRRGGHGGYGSPQPCSTNSQLPCLCPSGTDYWESSTWAVIGATAQDVKDLIMDYYKCAWLGVVPYETHGPDNKPGVSIRTSFLPTKVGVYSITEKEMARLKQHLSLHIMPWKLVENLDINPRGGFIEKFEQLASTVPVPYTSGNGSFSGYWVTLESTYIFQNETAIRWSIYACETGHARNFAVFHENALKNATTVLAAQGKIKGTNIGPYSYQNF
ncbi:hypothetical protein CJF30_00010515 [Rutstroemia sp. NJR-2017a BBW]|nr:hypothetical protein CJF30_00010515 [Rutstroemia sp. NJR-2017a BBW]